METRKIKIYQTKDWCKYSFMNYDFAKSHDFKMEDYELVAEFNREDYVPIDRMLEIIFDLGNRGIIQQVCNDEFMRSISVSDVIEVDGVMYYVDSFGFKEVK